MIYFSIAHLLESFGPRYFHCLGFIGLCRKVFGAFSQLEFWKGKIRGCGNVEIWSMIPQRQFLNKFKQMLS